MLTVIETQLFRKLWPNYWTEEERGEFAAFIARYPAAGVVIPGCVRQVVQIGGQGLRVKRPF